jgi:hypothetical protein
VPLPFGAALLNCTHAKQVKAIMKKLKLIATICIILCVLFVIIACNNIDNDDNGNLATQTAQNYNFVLEKIGQGTTVGGGKFEQGEIIIISATAEIDWIFEGFYNGDVLVADTSPYTFEMPNDNLTLTAKFSKNVYVVSVEESGRGNAYGAGKYLIGENVTLTAFASLNYEFDGWYIGTQKISSSAVYDFIMPSNDMIFTAKFIAIPSYTLTVTKVGNGSILGSVTVLSSFTSRTGTFNRGQTVTLTASAGTGSTFEGWYQGNTLISSSYILHYSMPNSNVTIQARFSN